MNRLLWQSSLRYLPRHPWQLALCVAGIALGVAVVLAVDLATASARKSFQLSLEQVTGRATHRIVGGRSGIPETLYTWLRVAQGLRETAPVVTGFAELADNSGRQIRIMGVDIFAESAFRGHSVRGDRSDADVTALLTRPYAALLPPDLGQHAEIEVGNKRIDLHGAGRLDLAYSNDLILTDIATAQLLFDRLGRLDYIDLILPAGDAGRRLAESIAAGLPPGVSLERAAERDRAVAELSAAFELNLTALSLLALLVGMFLIYNTMTFAVVQRRGLLGLLRALGVSRREAFTLVLGEALLLGLAGTLLGGILGLWLGSALVHLVTRTINDLYYVVSVREFHIAPLSLLKGAALGVLATAIAAWLPAREAAHAPPTAALSRAHLESRWQRALPRLACAGLCLACAGSAVLIAWNTLIGGFVGLFVIVLGATLLTPGGVVLLTRFAQRLAAGGGFTARMAIRDVERNLSRTGVAVTALMVAFAATVGVKVMVDSFRGGVEVWLQDLLNADLYVAPASDDGAAHLEAELVEALRGSPRLAALSTYRRQTVRVEQRLVDLIAVDLASPARSGYRFVAGDPANAWRVLAEEGAVLISEPLAYHHRLDIGDRLTLRTDQGPRDFAVAGIFHDYGSEHGRILIDRNTYQRFWNDRAVGSVGVYGAPGQDLADLRRRIEELGNHFQPIVVHSSHDIRQASLAVFDRTFAITAVLRLLAIAVAFVGMLSALMALQLERARELAMLRALGMTAREIGGMVSLQTAYLGLISGLLAVPAGLGLAAFLIQVIQRRAFGWTLPFTIEPWILIQTLGLAVAAALLAGLYPIWRMARSNPADALRAE